MAVHEDDPGRVGNLSDSDYEAALAARAAEHGYAGLHVIPADVLAAAEGHLEGEVDSD